MINVPSLYVAIIRHVIMIVSLKPLVRINQTIWRVTSLKRYHDPQIGRSDTRR